MSADGCRWSLFSLLLCSIVVTARSSGPVGPEELLSGVADQEASLLQQLFGDENATTVGSPGTASQSKVWKLEDDGQESVLKLAGTGVSMSVPGSAYTGLGDVACVVTVFDPAVVDPGSDGGDVQAVASAVNVELFSYSTQERVTVSGLSEPIEVRMPVNSSSNAECAYWNNETKSWDTEGLVTTIVNGQLVCETTHLTFFAAIIRGIVKALLCSNLNLFHRDTVKVMLEGDWYRTPLAISYWVVLLALIILLVAACKVDSSRATRGSWDDERFLILVDPNQAHTHPNPGNAKSRCAVGCCCAAGVFCGQLPWGTVLRDVLDDLMSRWCAHFSEVRDFVENMAEVVGRAPELVTAAGIHGLMQVVIGTSVRNSVRRQACAELGVSTNVVDFVLENKDLKEILEEPRASGWRRAVEKECSGEQRKFLSEWRELHDKVLRTVDEKWEESATWRSLPKVITKVFLISNPFVAVFLRDYSWTSSLRLLFLTCEVCGAMVISTVFFTALGMMRGRESREADCLHRGIGEIIGRLVIIGLCSMFLATLPVHFLEALHDRSLVKISHDRRGRQLNVWRVQDTIIWVSGSLYVGFCLFFLALFLANVHPMDHRAWAFTASVALLQQIVVIPLGVAVATPAFTTTLLSIVSYWRGDSRAELLRQRRSEQSLKGNWRLSVGSV